MPKGTIVLVPFPFTDLSMNKVRPCVVLYEQRNGEDCVLACISSVRQKRSGTFDIKIKSSAANGLKIDSVIKTEKIATLQKKIILCELGMLEKSLIKEVDAKLRVLFKL